MLWGILQKKRRTTGKKALAYRGKGGQKYRYCFSCLTVRGGKPVCFNDVDVQKRGFTKFSVFLKRVSLLNPRVRTNFMAFPIGRTRKEPRSSVLFWAATGV